jgi:sulfate transport system substrate-binding protein
MLIGGLALLAGIGAAAQAKDIKLLNVSYDPTRELYQDFNKAFAEEWKKKTGDNVIVNQSHGGAGKQARAVIDGLEADVVTLALPTDIDQISDKTGWIPKDWQTKLPNNSEPYTSTIVFLVRTGNPKGIKDWDDLVKPGVSVITPNPKTSGGARYNYLAAWGYELQKTGSADKAKQFVTELYKHVPVLDSGARGSTNTFVQRGVGDVLLTWENEAFLTLNELGPGKFDIIVPSVSILAETPVAVVETVAKKHGTSDVARAYLEFLYSQEGQRIVAKHYYRPSKPEYAAAEDIKRFPQVKLFSVTDVFGNWQEAQKHFADNGTFDQIYVPAN